MGKTEWERKITSCFINETKYGYNEIFVIYDDSTREVMWRYNPKRYNFDYKMFIGMTKMDAAFYCDRKLPVREESVDVLYVRW